MPNTPPENGSTPSASALKFSYGVIGIFFTLLISGTGCSTRLPVSGVNAFYNYDYATAVSTFRELSKKEDDKDVVVYRLGLLSAAMTAGDYWDAERAFSDANRVMWSDAGAGKGQASMVSA